MGKRKIEVFVADYSVRFKRGARHQKVQVITLPVRFPAVAPKLVDAMDLLIITK